MSNIPGFAALSILSFHAIHTNHLAMPLDCLNAQKKRLPAFARRRRAGATTSSGVNRNIINDSPRSFQQQHSFTIGEAKLRQSQPVIPITNAVRQRLVPGNARAPQQSGVSTASGASPRPTCRMNSKKSVMGFGLKQ